MPSAASGLVAERPPDQLQADRQAALAEAGRHDQRRQAEIVDRPHEARDALDDRLGIAGAADIGLGDASARPRATPAPAPRRICRSPRDALRARARASAALRDIRPRCRRARSPAGCAPARRSPAAACAATAHDRSRPRPRARSARRPRPAIWSGRSTCTTLTPSFLKVAIASSSALATSGFEIVDIEALRHADGQRPSRAASSPSRPTSARRAVVGSSGSGPAMIDSDQRAVLGASAPAARRCRA